MYPIGLLPLFQAFVDEGAVIKVVIMIPSVVILLWLWTWATSKLEEKDESPVFLPEWSIFTTSPFFKSRFDFLNWGFQLTGHSVFQFSLLRNTVIAVSGERGRRDFFTSKGLDINEGFKVLSGAIPMLPGVTSDLQARRISLIHKRLATVQNSDHLSRNISRILDDAERVMSTWGRSGTLDPFDCIPKLVFQTTVRSLASSELADDEAVVTRLKELYDTLDTSTTPASVLLPWFPSPSMITKLLATKRIYDIVNRAIDARMQSGVPQDDTLQILLDSTDDKLVMLGFIMGLLVAGARSTGTTASWLITFLGGHPHWKNQAEAEVRQILSTHAVESSSSEPHSNARKLASIPLEVWETQTPVLDSIIRETLRVAQPHTAMRRNMGPETYVNGVKVPSGAYVVYPFSDVHLDPQLYPDPWAFDPSRVEYKMPLAYVGWGGGKTVCLGQRLAKLSLKLITSLLLLDFNFDLIDKTGQFPNPLPRPNWNDALTCRPKESYYLRLTRTDCCTSP